MLNQLNPDKFPKLRIDLDRESQLGYNLEFMVGYQVPEKDEQAPYPSQKQWNFNRHQPVLSDNARSLQELSSRYLPLEKFKFMTSLQEI